MSKSTGGRGFGRRSGTVTVIEQQVHRSAAEHARFAFILTAIVTGLVALVVAKSHMHPLLAVFVAAPIAAFCGLLVWIVARIWPVLRLIWWWIPEIIGTVLAAWAWTILAVNTPALLTLAVLAAIIGVPALVPVARHAVIALFWCVTVRHRLRVCFSQFIIANKSGSLPLILGARPTPVGERVWVYLRPGLALSDLQNRLDQIAVACHASSVLIEHASRNKKAAYLRFDIKRREVLTADVASPLIDLVEAETPLADKKPATVIDGLDLPDVHDTATSSATTAKPKAASSANGRKPASSATEPETDDLNQWI